MSNFGFTLNLAIKKIYQNKESFCLKNVKGFLNASFILEVLIFVLSYSLLSSFIYFTVYNNAIKPLFIKFPEKPIAPRSSIFGQ